jgi:hypothetical protein
MGTMRGALFFVSCSTNRPGARAAARSSPSRSPEYHRHRIVARTPLWPHRLARPSISARLTITSRALRTVGTTTRAAGSLSAIAWRFQAHRQAARR